MPADRPAGASAPRRATPDQVKMVRGVLQHQVRELNKLTAKQVNGMQPALEQAQAELTASMADWMRRYPDGDLRWTAQKYRAALVQVRMMSLMLGQEVGKTIGDGAFEANWLAIKHLAEETARFSSVFEGSMRALPIDVAKQLADGRSYIIPTIRTSSARYAGQVAEDIRERLLVDILKGESVRDTVNKLVAHGGPRGMVSLRGVAGEPGSIVEYIPEGLFARYRFWAERVVRTELTSAYNARLQESLFEAAPYVPGAMKRWCADGMGCARICSPIDGQTVPINEAFSTSIGFAFTAPAHPNCMCRIGMWNEDWPQILDSVGDDDNSYEPWSAQDADEVLVRIDDTMVSPFGRSGSDAARMAWKSGRS